jgi:hypothetical protein
MDGIRYQRITHRFRVIKIGLFVSFFIGGQTSWTSNGDAAQQDTPSPPELASVTRNTLFLHQLCDSNFDEQVNWCEGYLMGLADVLLAMGNSRIAGGICKAEYQPDTLSRIFKYWVQRHPENFEDDMAVSAQAALREVWPCP